jgi:hypothetical protein
VTTTEPEWDDEQRLLILAWSDWEADRGPHGHSMTEATSPEADPANREGSVLFVGEEPIRDFAEAARDAKRKSYEAQYPDADLSGLIWPVKRVERTPHVGGVPRRHGGGTNLPAPE